MSSLFFPTEVWWPIHELFIMLSLIPHVNRRLRGTNVREIPNKGRPYIVTTNDSPPNEALVNEVSSERKVVQ
jgi:hypothetical protein